MLRDIFNLPITSLLTDDLKIVKDVAMHKTGKKRES